MACSGETVPNKASNTSIAGVFELEIVIEPQEAGDYVLDPKPDEQGAFIAGTIVTIDILPKRGWRVEQWVGPTYDEATRTAHIRMNSNRMVAVRLVAKKAPARTPAPIVVVKQVETW